MGSTSKDLLRFQHKTSSTSPLESALLVCKKKDSSSEPHKFDPTKKPNISSVPRSEVLGKVKDFLGVMAEANKRLELDSKDNYQAYDIEVLNVNESEVVEMDLMLGVADRQLLRLWLLLSLPSPVISQQLHWLVVMKQN